jgi:hypothetical protein
MVIVAMVDKRSGGVPDELCNFVVVNKLITLFQQLDETLIKLEFAISIKNQKC